MVDNLDNIISEALKLREEGISSPEIFKKFPAYKKELEEIFNLIGFLKKSGESINPPDSLLYDLINREKKEEGRNFFTFAFFARLTRVLSPKQYAGLATILFLLVATGFGFSYFSNNREYAISKAVKNLDSEINSFDQNTSELEQAVSDKGLENIDEDMLAVAELDLEDSGSGAEEETIDYKTDVSSLENELKGLEDDLNGYSADQPDLKSIEEDSSLDNLDSTLSEII